MAIVIRGVVFFSCLFGYNKRRWDLSPRTAFVEVMLQIRKKFPLFFCSTEKELRAGNRVRTDGLQLGKLTLYQLSYTRF